MATKNTAAGKAGPHAHLDDETVYAATVRRPFRVGRTWVRPGQAVRLKGKVIKDHADGIAEAVAG